MLRRFLNIGNRLGCAVIAFCPSRPSSREASVRGMSRVTFHTDRAGFP